METGLDEGKNEKGFAKKIKTWLESFCRNPSIQFLKQQKCISPDPRYMRYIWT